MNNKVTYSNGSGNKISAYLCIPKQSNGCAIVILHCFLCSKDHPIPHNLSKKLVESGFTTLSFDFSGNGESEGKIEDSTYTKMIGDVSFAINFLESYGYKKFGIVGHSLGAMISLLSASFEKRISAVAFISGSSQAERVREVFPIGVVKKAELHGFAKARVYGKDIVLSKKFLEDIDLYNVGYSVATLERPLLILHGKDDEIIEPHHARKLYNWAKEPKTLELIDGDHQFHKSVDLVAEKVSSFFKTTVIL